MVFYHDMFLVKHVRGKYTYIILFCFILSVRESVINLYADKIASRQRRTIDIL